MLDRDSLKLFAPRADVTYVDALLSDTGLKAITEACDNDPGVLVHFMGQCAAETDYFRVFREDLSYKTIGALRDSWPARFRHKSNDELRPLLRNPIALGDAVYGGRMGNTQPGEGFAYRGGGPGQVTGKAAVAAYAKKLGLEPSAALLDDPLVCLQMFCLEWKESKCTKWARQNDCLAVSKAINTGSATSGVQPNGMKQRENATAKAQRIWGERAAPPVVVAEMLPKPDATTVDLQGSRKFSMLQWLKWKLGFAGGIGTVGLLDDFGPKELWGYKDYVHDFIGLIKLNGLALLVVGSAVGIVGVFVIQWWMVQDVRNGTYIPSGRSNRAAG